MIKSRDEQDLLYKSIVQQLQKYEDNNLEYYTDSDLTKRVLTHPQIGDLKEKMDQTYEGWKNPYRDAYIWLKGELIDMKGISDALAGREAVVKAQSNVMSKKRSDQAELDKLNQGKKSMKNFFKSKSAKENDMVNLQSNIELANKDLEDYSKLINFLTIYHGQVAVPKFKNGKAN